MKPPPPDPPAPYRSPARVLRASEMKDVKKMQKRTRSAIRRFTFLGVGLAIVYALAASVDAGLIGNGHTSASASVTALLAAIIAVVCLGKWFDR